MQNVFTGNAFYETGLYSTRSSRVSLTRMMCTCSSFIVQSVNSTIIIMKGRGCFSAELTS